MQLFAYNHVKIMWLVYLHAVIIERYRDHCTYTYTRIAAAEGSLRTKKWKNNLLYTIIVSHAVGVIQSWINSWIKLQPKVKSS